jgi:hypothetical protein
MRPIAFRVRCVGLRRWQQNKTTRILQKTIGLGIAAVKKSARNRVAHKRGTEAHRAAFRCQFESDAVAREEAVHVGGKLF